MADQPNVFNTLINPIQVQSYERYLPTAFDEGMTLLEKVNKVILQLNRIGKLSNDVLDQWNQVMDWVMADGLDASIDSKIDSMLQDGSLATIIGSAITDLGNEMGSLSNLTTTDKSSIVNAINSLMSSLTSFQTTINGQMTAFSNNLYYGRPEDYGAKGDGVTDDTVAIQNCLNANAVTVLRHTDYKITSSLKLPVDHSIQGNGGRFLVSGTWTPNTFGGSIPVNVLLWVVAREPVAFNDEDMTSCFVHDLRLKGDSNYNLIGMYFGYSNQNNISQATTVNYSVYGMDFKNITLNNLYDGLQIAEVWQSNFDGIKTNYINNYACKIIGQSVNNTFKGCQFSTTSQGQGGLYIDHGTYSGITKRPEGNMFIGGYIGSSQIGVRIEDGFVTKFSNVIFDINTTEAVLIGNFAEDTTFDTCYLMSSGIEVVNIADSSNSNFTTFKGCNFIPTSSSTHACIVGQNQVVIIDGCEITDTITFASTARGRVINNIWNAVSSSTPMIVLNGASVDQRNNNYKLDFAPVIVG